MKALARYFTPRAFACLGVITFGFMLVSGAANAAFKVRFVGDAGAGINLTIEDGDPLDLADGEAGFIRFAFELDGLAIAGSASSKDVVGSATTPALILNVAAFEYAGSLDISVTDTDFSAAAQTANAWVLNAGIDGGDTITFQYFADTANTEFGTATTIATIGPFPSPLLTQSITDFGASSDVGSLTMVASLDEGIGFPFEGTFTMVLTQDGGGGIDFPVPNVLGLSEAEAEAELVAAGFIVGEIFYVEACSVASGTVLDQDPDAGVNAPPGSEVDLTVSQCTASSDNAIPTLSEWGMIMMIALLALIGGRRIWRS